MKLIYYLFLGLAFFSCNQENICPSEIEIGAFKLLEASKAAFPYTPTDSVFVFKNIQGEEYRFRAVNKAHTIIGLGSRKEACNTEGDTIIYKFTTQSKSIDFWHDSLNLGFTVDLYTLVNQEELEKKEVADVLYILEREPFFDNSFPVALHVVLDQRNHGPFYFAAPSFAEEKTLGLRTFHQVYWDEDFGPWRKYILYYNNEFGLIGIENPQNDFLLWFDRKE